MVLGERLIPSINKNILLPLAISGVIFGGLVLKDSPFPRIPQTGSGSRKQEDREKEEAGDKNKGKAKEKLEKKNK